MKKRVLSLILAFALILGCIPTVFAADPASGISGTGAAAPGGPLSLTQSGQSGQVQTGFAPSASESGNETDDTLTKFESSGRLPFSQNEAAERPEADDIVTFIVVTEDKPLLEKFPAVEIASQTAAVQRHERTQISTLNAVKASVRSALGKEEGFELGYTYTVATSGFSVTTAYGNKAEIEKMNGVKKVYVAPTFTLPEDGLDADPMTSNSSAMIGANALNASGYTGKGMRIAILDTGILVDHPNFAALSDAQLEDPMTRDSVERIWDDLNASERTTMLNRSYYNSKIPYVFNYVTGDFDVSNTFAGSDHGTHVAGIAAANKIEGSNVVGVAPDAQLVVMQVFEQGGGAGWDTIMAALEDCVRLEVDAANLSLGAASGFTDPDDDMLKTVELFQETDIQLLIAAGNDTNSAYMNAWGNNMSLIENPDIGLAGTPSTYSAALAVASVDNDGFEQLYITVGGREFGYQDSAATSATSFIQNFRNQTLEYVVVPGIGAADDYEGLNVTGKVALVSRGSSSFPEKQSIAQENGAVACIIYNNDLGIINMQINDGVGNIPCVSITRGAGAYLIEQAGDDGVGTLKVCNADIKLFNVDRSISSFSSWGVTPDLKLKPEIAGVGGNIYSTVDPAISGSYYGSMSGTSMATPQITGAMAVLIEYLDKNYPDLTGAEQRKVAADLLMSTAEPLVTASGLEYSPRAQGAGLANLVNATSTPAYLTNPAASEGRPKVEFGDDPAKTGVYTFDFVVENLSDKALTYEISSSVLTEAIYAGEFIANAPYALEAKVSVDGPVQVPAGGSTTVRATLTLTENDKLYLKQFPNGIYVEGYLYARPAGGEGVTLTMPMVGFYGDWSAADVFDSHSLTEDAYSLYPTVAFTNNSTLGSNPYFRSGKSGDKYNAFSYANLLAEIDFALLRNVKRMDISVVNAENPGTVYYTLDGAYLTKTYYNASYGMAIPMYLIAEYGEVWDGKDQNGNRLPEGTTVTYQFEAWLDDGDDIMDDKWSFDVTLDNQAPEVLNAYELQQSLRFDGDRTYLTLEIRDSEYVAAVLFLSESGSIMGKFQLDNEPGQTVTQEFDITGFGSQFTILVADYACNETEIDVALNLGEQNDANPKPVALDKDRLYGNETFDSAIVEPGWFSANRADLSNPRNETFDSANRYYSAEYVNGYLVAQNANTGDLELVIPSGTYWSARTLAKNEGNVGDRGVWVLYDMALDHSGTLAESYGVGWNTDAEDALLAVGWLYQGDNNNDGHDDGYNALFNIEFTNYGDVYVREIARITGLENNAELLTLGITTEGAVYGIGTDGVLYSVGTSKEWDESVGEWGAEVIKVTKIGATDFVNYPNFGGVNVIQSMGYDHNTGTMYWYAHSQVSSGYYYENINVTYKVNLETAKCEVVGTYGAGGQTCLFVPNDLESDLFTMGVEPSDLRVDPDSTYMVQGQTKRLNVTWQPWNAEPVDVTWSSSDESIATVDAYGFVTAHKEGEVTISATATVNVAPGWGYDQNGQWGWLEGGPTEKTKDCLVTVMASEDALYSYVIADFGNPDSSMSWMTYSDKTPGDETVIGRPTLPTDDGEGGMVQTDAMWQGGTYYNGYVYTVRDEVWTEDNVIYTGTALYRSPVTKGETPEQTVIGEPEFIGTAQNLTITAMAFDYNTGRMYCLENRSVGGLGIMDLETGAVDMLGLPNGDLSGAVYILGMCITPDGTIVISDGVSNLYTIDPDTLTTKRIYAGNGDAYSAYYEAMAYDYNTGCIYWNPCDGNRASHLYMVMLPEQEWEQATVVNLGDVSTKNGVQQTVMFAIPDEEPETRLLPVESIEITNGEAVTGLEGGSLKLGTQTVPARPTIQTKTWSSSDESVVKVDSYGTMTYVGVGTATVTVSITNKDEATYGGPFTDSIDVTVLESAGEFVAFLNSDTDGGSGYYDFWLKGNDYDLRHVQPTDSMISIYSLRTGVYYDGYFYAYNDKGQFMRIDAENPDNYKILGTLNRNLNNYQVTGMAIDYTTGVLYGLTLPANYTVETWSAVRQVGELVTIDMETGTVTTVAELDYTAPVFALACDADGQLYAAGGHMDAYAGSATIYKLDKETGEQTEYVTIPDAGVYTGYNYFSPQYNTQMTYDFGTDRLYLCATTDQQGDSVSHGMYMVQMGDEPFVANLGRISLYTRAGSDVKDGSVYLGLLAFVPEDDEVPVSDVNGIILNKDYGRIPVGGTTQLVAQVRPSNAPDKSLTWESSDETVATVDANGLVTGVAVGTATITVTSVNGVSARCAINVISVSGPQNLAYTVSAKKDALISFNPALPAQTATVVASFSGGTSIRGLAYGDNCLYYLTYTNWSSELYRYDFTTKQSTAMGRLYTFNEPSDIAYDAENNLLYVVGGFYVFQFDVASLDPAGFNYYSGYWEDEDDCTMAGVEVVDGAVYTLGTDLYTSAVTLIRYDDKYMGGRTIISSNVDVPVVAQATDMAYHAVEGKFYMTDAGHNIYAVDLNGNATLVDILGDGIDMNGLTIDPTAKYYITYTDGVDGEVVFPDQQHGALEGAATPDFAGTPTRTGYTFAGWTPMVAETVSSDMTYTATWTANTYTVTLDPNGGTVGSTTVTVTYDQPMGQLPVPAKEGYVFEGWFTDEGEYTADTVYKQAGDLVLTAVWTADTYTVTLDPNGGDMESQTISVTYDHAIGELPVPTREGCTFGGWYDADGNVYTAETIYTVAKDLTLTAKWIGNTYTITLDGGTVIEVTYGEPVGALPAPSREGYTFGGWFDGNGNAYTAETVYQVVGNVELTSAWTANTYTITLDGTTAIEVTYGEPVGELPVPSREGYTFGGWFDGNGSAYTAETVYQVAGNVELTSAWTANTYTITLDDGTVIEVTYGEPVGELPVPAKYGSSFLGWFDENGKKYTAETVYTVAGDLTLTAVWSTDVYTITLDGTTSIEVTYGEAIGELPTPTREGYTFGGWFDENGYEYTAETLYKLLTDLELTSAWTANTYTITLGDGIAIEVTYGEPVGELPTPTREGYSFDGWFDEDGKEYTAETVYTVAGDLTLTAAWTQIDGSNSQTGDVVPVALLAGLMFLSASALIVLTVIRKKDSLTVKN